MIWTYTQRATICLLLGPTNSLMVVVYPGGLLHAWNKSYPDAGVLFMHMDSATGEVWPDRDPKGEAPRWRI